MAGERRLQRAIDLGPLRAGIQRVQPAADLQLLEFFAACLPWFAATELFGVAVDIGRGLRDLGPSACRSAGVILQLCLHLGVPLGRNHRLELAGLAAVRRR